MGTDRYRWVRRKNFGFGHHTSVHLRTPPYQSAPSDQSDPSDPSAPSAPSDPSDQSDQSDNNRFSENTAENQILLQYSIANIKILY